MYKSKKIIDKIKSFESDSLFLKDFFSKEELAQMQSWAETCMNEKDNTFSRCIDKNAIDNDLTSTATGPLKVEIINFLEKKLNPVLNPLNDKNLEYDFAFHANKKPYGIHTDSGYDETEVAFKQGIIPLKIYPSNKSIYTVILNQRCYHSSAFPNIKEDTELQKHVEGLNFSQPISGDQFMEYWENTPYRHKQLRGYSVDLPFKWGLGDTAIWDRSKIHCSSDFSVTGVQFKLGLMWVSRVVT